ncbi:hypothetical protein [Catellatospora methionotrophica]|uniref:hypothetical protein n=1 Tax=Catellatospora methionotrophica TaxID=121620 RepID=UPI00340DD463
MLLDRLVRSAVAGMDQARRRQLRWAPALASGVAVAVPAAVYLSQNHWLPTSYVLYPWLIGLATLLVAYAVVVGGLLRGTAEPPPGLRLMTALALCGCLFWAAGNLARQEGRRLASEFWTGRGVTTVTVFSTDRLYLSGVQVTDLDMLSGHPRDGGAFRYRYENLRLVDHIGGRYFLLAEGSGLIVLSEARGLRFEFVASQD